MRSVGYSLALMSVHRHEINERPSMPNSVTVAGANAILNRPTQLMVLTAGKNESKRMVLKTISCF